MADSEPRRPVLLIVHMARVLNGPFATTILNDLGARVIGSSSGRMFTSQVKRSV